MPAVYEKHGLQFQYPENWRLQENAPDRLPHEITLETPQGGFWSLSVYPLQADLNQLCQESLQEFQRQYETCESIQFAGKFAGQMAYGWDLSFFCLDLVIDAKIRCFHTPSFACLLLTQAETREFEQLECVFDAVSTSLLCDTPVPITR